MTFYAIRLKDWSEVSCTSPTVLHMFSSDAAWANGRTGPLIADENILPRLKSAHANSASKEITQPPSPSIYHDQVAYGQQSFIRPSNY